MRKLASILFWSIISAAFIGPGTVTTAASAGSLFGFDLIWALVFSTIACLILQEAAARITILSGMPLGRALARQYAGKTTRMLVLSLVVGAVIIGCAAYEAGNILGGVAGAVLGTGWPAHSLSIILVALAGLLLWFGSARTVALFLGCVVALMGFAFLAAALMLAPSIADISRGALLPSLPQGSSLLVLGLVGTTVVPYNLFLGSGIASKSGLAEMRFGLSIAILLGGVISIAVLVVGSFVQAPFSYESLSEVLRMTAGPTGALLFAFGLFAAGFSSAITAPMAAAITARDLFSGDKKPWDEQAWRYRSVWLAVLLTGLLFGLAGVKPVPVIILAQALNGILLPFVSIFLLIIVNDRNIMGQDGINSHRLNILSGLVVWITILLGILNILKATTGSPDGLSVLGMATFFSLLIAYPVYRKIIAVREG